MHIADNLSIHLLEEKGCFIPRLNLFLHSLETHNGPGHTHHALLSFHHVE